MSRIDAIILTEEVVKSRTIGSFAISYSDIFVVGHKRVLTHVNGTRSLKEKFLLTYGCFSFSKWS